MDSATQSHDHDPIHDAGRRILGKAVYMSPSRRAGRGGQAADILAFGCVPTRFSRVDACSKVTNSARGGRADKGSYWSAYPLTHPPPFATARAVSSGPEPRARHRHRPTRHGRALTEPSQHCVRSAVNRAVEREANLTWAIATGTSRPRGARRRMVSGRRPDCRTRTLFGGPAESLLRRLRWTPSMGRVDRADVVALSRMPFLVSARRQEVQLYLGRLDIGGHGHRRDEGASGPFSRRMGSRSGFTRTSR